MDRGETNLEEGHHGESPVGFSPVASGWLCGPQQALPRS